MIFITVSPRQAAQYSYACLKLKQMVSKMRTARQTLEDIANASFDKVFARCVYMLTSESLQCENEILAHINSLNCYSYGNERTENKKTPVLASINGIESICKYFEEVYLDSYKKLLKDKHLGSSVKSLIQNHVRLFISNLTQLRLFNDVKPVAN